MTTERQYIVVASPRELMRVRGLDTYVTILFASSPNEAKELARAKSANFRPDPRYAPLTARRVSSSRYFVL
jgi:hypothetical protein